MAFWQDATYSRCCSSNRLQYRSRQRRRRRSKRTVSPLSMTYHQVYTNALCPALSEHDDELADGGAIFSGKNSAAKQYSRADLDRIPALPHTDPNKFFVLDMEAVQGRRYGGMSSLYLCAGVLTLLVSDVAEGVHFRTVRILERNPQRRHQATHQPTTLTSNAVRDPDSVRTLLVCNPGRGDIKNVKFTIYRNYIYTPYG